MSDQTHCSSCQGHLRGFVCTYCTSASESTAAKQTPEEPLITHRDAQSFWSTITDEKAALLAIYYEEIVQWKPEFLSLRKNKAGHNFIQTLNVIFTALVDRGQHSTSAMKTAMVMPHPLLARTKDANDGSIGQTLSRRLDQWLNGQFESLVNEAKALQLRQKKTMTKHKHDTFKEFDQQMTSGKISNALRYLDETEKGQVLALNDLTKGKSVYQILLDKHPKPSELSENDIVSNQYENTLHYHSSIFNKLNAPSIRKCAMKARGSPRPIRTRR